MAASGKSGRGTGLLREHRRLLDLSCVQLGGSQTICRNGGQGVGYQGRKVAKSCNSLFLANNRWLMLVCSCPLAGQHHDLFRIKQVFRVLCDLLKEAGIETGGLFLNADAGFDSKLFRRQCTGIKIKANMAFHARNAEPPEACTYFERKAIQEKECH